MEGFCYKEGELYCEELPVSRAVDEFGSPLFLYSQSAIIGRARSLKEAFSDVPTTICYSVKANSNLSILSLLAAEGVGFDIVSGGELYRVLRATGDASQVVFAGVGKTEKEIRYALENDMWMFNIECEAELDDIGRAASDMNKTARVAIRINPDVEADTHHHITTGKKETKFGLPPEVAIKLAEKAAGMKGVEISGLHAHIGSQIIDTAPFALAMEKLLEYADALEKRSIPIEYVDIGGGFGIKYKDEVPPSAEAFADAIAPLVKQAGKKLIIEPGRSMVGNAGIMLTRIIHKKQAGGGKNYMICDAGMSDLMRPVLYDAYHAIWPVKGAAAPFLGGDMHEQKVSKVDVVGPICETGDYLAKGRLLPHAGQGDLLAVFSAGAYGIIMSSNYNSRGRAAEVLVDGEDMRLIRAREEYRDMVRLEEERCNDLSGLRSTVR